MTVPGEDQDALFDVPELLPPDPAKLGRVEAGTYRAVQAGTTAGTLVTEDAGMIGAALVAARQLDQAERIAASRLDTKAGYLIAQLLPAYQEAMAALRLPAAVVPASAGRPAAAAPADLASLLGDTFGAG